MTREHQVVLVRQYRHSVQQTVLELPSGTVDPTDASPLAAVQRELLEETGYSGQDIIETGRLPPNSANHVNLTYCFLARGVEQVAEPSPEDTEHGETVLMPLMDVVRLASTGGLLQALHVGSLFFALHALGKLEIR